MSRIVEAFKNDKAVQRFLELKALIMNSKTLMTEYDNIFKTSDFSHNEASFEKSMYPEIFMEYFELKEQIEQDLNMIVGIIESGINSEDKA